MTAAEDGVRTWRWTQRTAGRMGGPELRRFLAHGALGQLRDLAPRIMDVLGVHPWAWSPIHPDDIVVPDSAAAQDAEERCATLPGFLHAHSHRPYLWAALLAARDRRPFDAELLYVASLLHDVGLPAAVAEHDPGCFTLRSGAVAAQTALEHQWHPGRRDALADVITLHLNTTIDTRHSAEAQLLCAAAALDIVGTRAWAIPPAARAAVLVRHPRRDFPTEFAGLMAAHAASAPATRTGALCRYGGLNWLIRMAPSSP